MRIERDVQRGKTIIKQVCINLLFSVFISRCYCLIWYLKCHQQCVVSTLSIIICRFIVWILKADVMGVIFFANFVFIYFRYTQSQENGNNLNEKDFGPCFCFLLKFLPIDKHWKRKFCYSKFCKCLHRSSYK